MNTYTVALRQLLRHTESLQAAAQVSDWEAVVRLLEERQALMAEVDGLAAAETPLPEGAQAAARGMLERIQAADGMMAEQVAAALNATRDEAAENRLAHTTAAAYRKSSLAAPPGQQARFVDRHR